MYIASTVLRQDLNYTRRVACGLDSLTAGSLAWAASQSTFFSFDVSDEANGSKHLSHG